MLIINRNPNATQDRALLGTQISNTNTISILGVICQPKLPSNPLSPVVPLEWMECFLCTPENLSTCCLYVPASAFLFLLNHRDSLQGGTSAVWLWLGTEGPQV